MWETVKTLNQKWVSHLGERSSIKMNEEHGLEHATGDSAGALPVASESEDKPLLILLPSKISETSKVVLGTFRGPGHSKITYTSVETPP